MAMMAVAAVLAIPGGVDAQTPGDPVAEAKDILMRSIGYRTVEGQGQVPVYAAYLASILRGSGFAEQDIEITPMGETATLVARYRGTSDAKPILLIGHMDVVEAKAEDWERDPFTAVEEGGYIFGRGSEDNKFDVAMIVATLARLKAEGYRPRRDIILALTGDEETQMATTQALARRFRDAELVLNGDGGGGLLGSDGQPIFYGLQAGEKTYADYRIEITDAGGHSSAPTATNAIYRLSAVLDRLAAHTFPNRSNPLTIASLKAASGQVGGEMGAAMARYAANPGDAAAAELIASRPEFVGQIRTTCVATMVDAGHAPNALPQRASANINCRIYPGVSIEAVKQQLERVAADDSATITVIDDPVASDASPLRPDVVAAVTKAVQARFPTLAVTPAMSPGATDSLHFRAAGVPSYGISGLFQRAEDSFAHGLNERVAVSEIAPVLAHYRSIITDLGG